VVQAARLRVEKHAPACEVHSRRNKLSQLGAKAGTEDRKGRKGKLGEFFADFASFCSTV
jgi:hypothetical protein